MRQIHIYTLLRAASLPQKILIWQFLFLLFRGAATLITLLLSILEHFLMKSVFPNTNTYRCPLINWLSFRAQKATTISEPNLKQSSRNQRGKKWERQTGSTVYIAAQCLSCFFLSLAPAICSAIVNCAIGIWEAPQQQQQLIFDNRSWDNNNNNNEKLPSLFLLLLIIFVAHSQTERANKVVEKTHGKFIDKNLYQKKKTKKKTNLISHNVYRIDPYTDTSRRYCTLHCTHTVPIRSLRTFLSPSYLSKQEIDDIGGEEGAGAGEGARS